MSFIVFRADASTEMGSGHIMRCLTLAEELVLHGSTVVFICREQEGHLGELIKSKGFKIYFLGKTNDFRVEQEYGDLEHSKWLRTSQEQDADETIKILKELGKLDWLIVDHYALDYRWENLIKPYVNKLMVIDDLADRKHSCDLLLDQNYYMDMKTRYEGLIPDGCKQLFGPKYALLRTEFLQARKKIKNRDGKIKRVFIFFGGSDPTNETAKTLETIKMLKNPDVTFDVVVGANNPNQDKIKYQCKTLKNTRFYSQINHIAEIMNNADLAIGAGGSTTWERCYLHLPTLTITIAANQKKTISDLQKKGIVFYLGPHDKVSSKDIYNYFIYILKNRPIMIDVYHNLKAMFTNDPISVSEILINA